MPGTIRVYELAKELKMSNTELLHLLESLGENVRSHSSTLSAESVAKVRGSVQKSDGAPPAPTPAPKPVADKLVEVFPGMTVRELAEAMGVGAPEIQKRLLAMRVIASVTQTLDLDVSSRLAEQMGYEVLTGMRPAPKAAAPSNGVRKGSSVNRPPVVTIMGHVDHGKTTLLDAIRHTDVTGGEFGGITQHIGAYQVEWDGRKITFLDTPGHAAFTAMRARGAQVTDIVVLVVAADDGIMPQTVEAINHAKAAGVPIIVAVNKIDREDANPDRVLTQLTEYELLAEAYGGDTMTVNVSAKKKTNLEDLLTGILVVAEDLDLTGDPAANPEGAVVEAQLDRGRGPVATVLVQQGILTVGDAVVVGETHGKIKAMLDDKGQRVLKAGPSTPVEIQGLSSVPNAGDRFTVVKDDRTARHLSEEEGMRKRTERLALRHRVTLQDLRRQMIEGETKVLNAIIKADVHGSLEAVRQSLEQLSDAEVKIDVVHSGVGNIGQSDILLATASNAIVIGFNVTVDNDARTMAQDESIDVRVYNIIYELIDDVRKAMLGKLEPVYEEVSLGHAECRAIFRTPRGPVAGSYVIDGKVTRAAEARVLRGKEVVWKGRLQSLRHVKDDVREVLTGFECGILLDGFTDIQVGDIVESFEMREVPRY
ncbi:MAG TPA: translation initiation factor IF-2 [Armatimonadota bacterium]|jgi:translation initiation factor IF-2